MLYCLLPPTVLKSKMFVSIQKYFQTDLKIPVMAASSSTNYINNWNKAKDLMSWGVKWTNAKYRANGRNVFSVENGLLYQNSGIYADDMGYFSGSSICVEKDYLNEPTVFEMAKLKDHVRHYFRVKYDKNPKYNKDGPILICLQTNVDASMRNHFPLCKTSKRNHTFLQYCVDNMPKGREVIVRAHPREKKLPDVKLPKEWLIDDYNLNQIDLAQKCSSMVVVNSTCATESLCLGLPIATFGQGAFYGSGVTLDCSANPKQLEGLLDFQPDWDSIDKYLCSVLRHQWPFGCDIEKILSHKGFVRWANKVIQNHGANRVTTTGQRKFADKPVEAKRERLCDTALIGYNGSGALELAKILSRHPPCGRIGVFKVGDTRVQEIIDDKTVKKIFITRDNLLEAYVDYKSGRFNQSTICNVDLNKLRRWAEVVCSQSPLIKSKCDIVLRYENIDLDLIKATFTNIEDDTLYSIINSVRYEEKNYSTVVSDYAAVVAGISDYKIISDNK